jgi:glycosyltransferase involved in cell wall biosynthesis
VAIVIPCHNEAQTIGNVVDDFRREMPSAAICVIDNCSTDETSQIARAHGARIIREPRLGKGFAIESIFDRIDADIYVLVDGDDTYPAEAVHDLLLPILAGDADMVVGTRLAAYGEGSFRPLHLFGNNLVCRLVNWVGHAHLRDIMSGYRAMTRRAILRVPVMSGGFDIETELTLQMLYHRMSIVEVVVSYKHRPAGSRSKLRTIPDGFRVLWRIFCLFRAFKPLTFFGTIGLLFLILGVLAGIPPIHDYLTEPDHYVRHVPLAILATGLVLLSGGCIFSGIFLQAMNWRLRELHSVITRAR